MRTPDKCVRSDESGASSLIAFLIATSVFVVTFGIVVETSLHSSNQGAPSAMESSLEVTAGRLAETLLASGVGWYSTVSCAGGSPDPTYLDGDSVTRLGLGRERCPGTRTTELDLSFDKMANLNDGKLVSDGSNGYLDYPESRASLGLGGYNFHIRSSPVLPDVHTALGTGARYPNERVAYVGAYTTLVGGIPQNYVVQKSCGATDGATSVAAWVDITNNGTVAADFEVDFAFQLQAAAFQFPQHTGVVLPGATTRVTANVAKTADWNWGGNTPKFAAAVSDTVRGLGACEASLAGITMTAATTNKLPIVRPEKLENILSGGSVSAKVYYEEYDGTGNLSGVPTSGSIEIQDTLGVPVATDASLDSRGWESFALTVPLSYNVVLKSILGTVVWSDKLNVLTATVGAFTPTEPLSGYAPQSGVVPESIYISSLAAGFTPKVYDAAYASAAVPHATGGDIYPDLRNVLTNDLVGQLVDGAGQATLANYNILVVGSSVDHNAMTGPAAKLKIRDWVYAGGYLMVMGSDQQAVNWLDRIFRSAITSASSALVTPDSTHPLLHTPNELDYSSFDDQGRAWKYNNGAEVYFTHVIASGADDVLSVSNTGAFGKGRVLLTSFEPWDLTGSGATGACHPSALTDACPALQAFHNFLTFAYRDLFLDYGPALPSGLPIGVVERIATVYHPDLARNVEIILLVYVF